MKLQHFRNALIAAGETDEQRAENLKIPLRTFKEYKAGRITKAVKRIMHPALLRALADDIERSAPCECEPAQIAS